MGETEQVVSVLSYYQYLRPNIDIVYTTHRFCGSCRRELHSPYHFPKFPEQLEAENASGSFSPDPDPDEPLEYFSYCPWCGAAFEDEWWKDRTIQNERAIDHYQNPGTHKGDTHEFCGTGPDCMAHHWLSVSGGNELCWCDPEVEPGIMGCVIRHTDKRYEDDMALREEMRREEDDDDESDEDWDEE